MLRCCFLTALDGHPLQPLCVESIKIQPGKLWKINKQFCSHSHNKEFLTDTVQAVPVDDANHAVLTVVGAVDAQFVQQVQQQHAEVTVKLADGGFKASV